MNIACTKRRPPIEIERVEAPVRLEKRLAASGGLEDILLRTNERLGDGVASPDTRGLGAHEKRPNLCSDRVTQAKNTPRRVAWSGRSGIIHAAGVQVLSFRQLLTETPSIRRRFRVG